MHAAVRWYLSAVQASFPQFFAGVSVLEIGSMNVNGSIRDHFQRSEHVGVDLAPGPNVDLVAAGGSIRLDRLFDVGISTESFEHDPEYLLSFENMVRHVRPGGMVLFTCAGRGRREHGTARFQPLDSPGTAVVGWNHYRNLQCSDFAGFPLSETFECFRFFENVVAHDLYFVGLKRPFDAAAARAGVEQIASVLGFDEPDRMRAQISTLLQEIEDLQGQLIDIRSGSDRVDSSQLQAERVLSQIRHQLDRMENSKSVRLLRLLPSFRKCMAAMREALGTSAATARTIRDTAP